jgi:hypothetical protein
MPTDHERLEEQRLAKAKGDVAMKVPCPCCEKGEGVDPCGCGDYEDGCDKCGGDGIVIIVCGACKGTGFLPGDCHEMILNCCYSDGADLMPIKTVAEEIADQEEGDVNIPF